MFKELFVLGLLFFVLIEARPTRTHEDEQEEAHAVLVSDSEDGEEALQEQAEGQGHRRRRSGRRNDDDDSSEERAPPRREKIPRLSRTGEDSEDAGDEEIGNQRRGWSSRKQTPRPRHSFRTTPARPAYADEDSGSAEEQTAPRVRPSSRRGHAPPPKRRPSNSDEDRSVESVNEGLPRLVRPGLEEAGEPERAPQVVFRPADEDDESAEERPATRKAKSRKTTPAPENSDEGSEERDEPRKRRTVRDWPEEPRGSSAATKEQRRQMLAARQAELDRRMSQKERELQDVQKRLAEAKAAERRQRIEAEIRVNRRKIDALRRQQG